MPLATGSRLGPYEVLGLLGAGAMGEVYRARDSRLGREVAVKVLPEEVALDPDRLSRFEREARAVAALSHPNILTVFDLGMTGPTAPVSAAAAGSGDGRLCSQHRGSHRWRRIQGAAWRHTLRRHGVSLPGSRRR